MKTLIVALLFFGAGISAYSQCINGKESYPLYKYGAMLVEEFDEKDYEIVRIEYDIIRTSRESFRTLSSDWEYTIIAFADQGVKDLDIKLYEYDTLLDKWKLVAEDNSEESFALVSYKPMKEVSCKVEIVIYEFNEGYDVARYGLMYVHE